MEKKAQVAEDYVGRWMKECLFNRLGGKARLVFGRRSKRGSRFRAKWLSPNPSIAWRSSSEKFQWKSWPTLSCRRVYGGWAPPASCRVWSSFPFFLWHRMSLSTTASALTLFFPDENGKYWRAEHAALTISTHITLICRTFTKDDSLQCHFSVFYARDFKPVVPSALLTVGDVKRENITLHITRVRFSMTGNYQCSDKLAIRRININVYGILKGISSAVQLLSKG